MFQKPFFALAAFAVTFAAPAFGAYAPSSGPSQTVPPATPPMVPATAPAAGQSAQTTGSSALSGLPDVSFSWSGYFEALAILCFVLALVWALLWLLKRRGGSGIFASSTPGMRLESRLALGPKKWLMVVRYQDRRLVLGVTDDRINLLAELRDDNAPPAVAQADIPKARPRPVLKKDFPAKETPSENEDNLKETLSFASFLKKDKEDSPS